MDAILDLLRDQIIFQGEFALRILLAGLLGAAIGFERKNRNKLAGVRTHAIVALGAALIMVVSKYGFYDMDKFDASRVAAQIVSGVGFLGAGIIFQDNLRVVLQKSDGAVKELEEYMTKEKIEIKAIKITKGDGNNLKVDFELLFPAGYDRTSFINRLVEKENIVSVRG